MYHHKVKGPAIFSDFYRFMVGDIFQCTPATGHRPRSPPDALVDLRLLHPGYQSVAPRCFRFGFRISTVLIDKKSMLGVINLHVDLRASGPPYLNLGSVPAHSDIVGNNPFLNMWKFGWCRPWVDRCRSMEGPLRGLALICLKYAILLLRPWASRHIYIYTYIYTLVSQIIYILIFFIEWFVNNIKENILIYM